MTNSQAASILVVDDLETSRNLAAGVLREQGYAVAMADGGKQALALVKEHGFGLVLLDYRMPEMNGLQVLKILRESYSPSALPVIMVTLKLDSDDIVTALKLGANDYVNKPIDFAVLFARIDTQLARRQAELELRKIQGDLERRVHERTLKLLTINKTLNNEIAERKRAEDALRVGERRYRELYDDTPSMFFTLDARGTILSVNKFGAEYVGYSVTELVGQPVQILFREQDKKALHERLTACLCAPDIIHRWEICKRRKNGHPLWVRESARVMTDAQGNPCVLVVCEDISEAHYLSQQLAHQASHDDLTGLVNRREFERRLQRVLKTAREDGSEHALCYLDLDQFKIINDTCGHIAGDELLRRLADLLKKSVRQRDTLARLGGDEFGVLMEQCSLAQARQVADDLRKLIERFRFTWDNAQFHVGASVGLVPITAGSEDISSVLSAADSACYVAKDAGRNRVHEYDVSDTLTSRRDTEIKRVLQIDRALEEGRFTLYYQPIVSIATGKTAGLHYELLVRMRGKDGRILAADSFLQTAERFNLVPKLDRWVVNTAFTWLKDHPAQLERTFLCAINLSGHSLVDEEFCYAVLYQLEKSGIPPEKICFEVTETAAIVNMTKAMRFISVLKERGCLFSLDDFGSGLSSFAYLKNLPVDFLKIDGQFVKDIVDDPTDFEMVKSINGIGHVMGKKTIAEFVENDAILQKLRDIGVDYAQGYGIGRPQPLEEFAG
ncbi:MAG: two-component system response regulator [Gammaproteobacteria bacterium]